MNELSVRCERSKIVRTVVRFFVYGLRCERHCVLLLSLVGLCSSMWWVPVISASGGLASITHGAGRNKLTDRYRYSRRTIQVW